MARVSLIGRLAAVTVACAAAVTVPVLAGPASAAVPGRTTAFQYTSYTSGNKGIRIDCPTGTTLIGAAPSLAGGEGQVRFDQVIPYDDHLYVHAVEDEDGYAYTWSVGATIVCADKPAGYQIVPSTSTTTSDQYNSVAADCPSTQNLLGMGFAINGGNGEVGIDDVKATSATRATGWAFEDRTGYSGLWSLTMYAICSDALPGYEIVGVQGPDQSANSATETATCAIAGNKIIGGGGQIDGGLGEVVLDDLTFTPTSFSIKAYEDQVGVSGSWHLHAYAICAKP
ncbi:hypothetical protein [Dactylosporangium salmoneum]|uniref:Secreted protein n=1 Tax=Dactylosporangium salmoneum TaxID=53361 RepID=A0ABN3H5W2_9ACTN